MGGREDIPVSSGKGENHRCRNNLFDWWEGVRQGSLCLYAMSKGETMERNIYSAPTDNLV